MMNAIPITPWTIDLIQALVGDANIHLEPDGEDLFFVWRGSGKPFSINTADQLKRISEYWAITQIMYIDPQ